MFSKTKLAAVALGLVTCVAVTATVEASTGNPINKGSRNPYTLAVIGDNPYGAQKIDAFPGFIDFINVDKEVDTVVHVGDIKSGSTLCTDEYFSWVRDELERLDEPVVFTPGDNEWTDCHRANNGNYHPLERLEQLRELFFPVAGETIGGKEKRVLTQASDPTHAEYVENVIWMESRVVFVTLNVPGSNNDLVPWTGQWAGDPQQAAEVAARDEANLAWLGKAFDIAADTKAEGVVLILQADMWDSFGSAATLSGYHELVNAIGNEAIEFEKPVLMLAGDSHVYREDQPYDGSPFFESRHPGQPDATNVTRVIVEGSNLPTNRMQYVRLTVNPKSDELFTIEQVNYAHP